MIYVMSDLHGEYEKYIKMLKLINFTDNDTLYILGDVVDRGNHPVKILKDMSMRANIYPLMGNHEIMALYLLKKLAVDITEDNYKSQIDTETMYALLDWQTEGGSTTIQEFTSLSKEERLDLINYIEEFSLYEIEEINGKLFIMVHSGLGNFSKDKELDDYTADELTCCRFDYSKKYFSNDNIYIITGHTPTLSITGKPEIYMCNNNINIDCGAVFENGQLACLCLDTMEAFYI